MEGLWVPLAGEGDDLLLGQRGDGAQLDDLALGEVFEVEDRSTCLSVSSGGRQ
jgi:hypothetical protein